MTTEHTVVEEFITKRVENAESIKRRAVACLCSLNSLLLYPAIVDEDIVAKANKYLPKIQKVIERGSKAKNFEKRMRYVEDLIQDVNLNLLKDMANKNFASQDKKLKIDTLSYLMTTGMLNTRVREVVKKQLIGLKYK
jgi:hypothetical protein